jgi:YggT family protein
MLYQILSFLLDVIAGLFCGACLLRAYMPIARVSFQNPIGQFVMALSNWLVLPLRRALPPVGAVDSASLVGALLIQLAHFVLLWLALGVLHGAGGGNLLNILWLAIFEVLKIAVTGMIGLLIVYAVLSFVQVRSAISSAIEALCALPLAPLRRIIPLVGGFDLSPLALIVLLQILLMVLQRTVAQLITF